MTPKEAIETLLDRGFSKYKIAKAMKMHTVMPHNILMGRVKTIRRDAAERLKEKFGIEIDDHYINGMTRGDFKEVADDE